jgi:hypothetical protein
MIRKYVYTSKHFVGEVLLWYNNESPELLVMFDISKAEVTREQHIAFLQSFPRSLEELKTLVAKDYTNRKIVEYFDEVTFEQFWERYNHKTLSHKKKSLIIWNKMSKASQQRAIDFIPKYEYNIRVSNISKKHAETYLNSEIWDN